MKAVVFHGIGDIRMEEVRDPKIEKPTDAIVRLTANAICGTDLHMVRGTLPGLKPGTILGHEGVGIIEKIGSAVRNLDVGDRVVIPSTWQTAPLDRTRKRDQSEAGASFAARACGVSSSRDRAIAVIR
jgi:threonine dehydrogenase-like Zn-dependent dehydrogenase